MNIYTRCIKHRGRESRSEKSDNAKSEVNRKMERRLREGNCTRGRLNLPPLYNVYSIYALILTYLRWWWSRNRNQTSIPDEQFSSNLFPRSEKYYFLIFPSRLTFSSCLAFSSLFLHSALFYMTFREIKQLEGISFENMLIYSPGNESMI